MKTIRLFPGALLVVAALLLATWTGLIAADQPQKKDDTDDEILVLTPFTVEAGPSPGYSATSSIAGARLGATVGGAQDARYFRDTVAEGGFPHPDTITAEGLFSEHDLPLRPRNAERSLLVLNAEAAPARLIGEPEVRYLAQIGLSSGLDAATWRRAPLNLVAVVDKSGSMSGQPLALVKRCLLQVLKQLGPDDQLSIVLYGDRSHVHLPPTRTTTEARGMIAASIDLITSAGATNMEAGLKVGFDLARRSQREFRGVTRLMQFTDERPNTGDTSREGFMGLMEAGARDGIGQTTVGVGVQFDAELAAEMSAVHGGNLFYFADATEMEKTFTEELDMMVTELASDLELTVRSASGQRIVAVYGIPGEMLEWGRNGREVSFRVNTVFLSKRKGGIFVAFAPEKRNAVAGKVRPGQSLASIGLSYREVGKKVATTGRLEAVVVAPSDMSDGLRRGTLLVNEYLGLRSAMTSHLVANRQAAAHQTLRRLETMLNADSDPALDLERAMVGTLTRSLAKLSGNGADPEVAAEDCEASFPVAIDAAAETDGYFARTIQLSQ
jgi:Ca-activated chloride channel family protein